MIIGSISEDTKFEKRVAITPDIIKKYKSFLNINVFPFKQILRKIVNE